MANYHYSSDRVSQRHRSMMPFSRRTIMIVLITCCAVIILSSTCSMEISVSRELFVPATTTPRNQQRAFPRMVQCLKASESDINADELRCKAVFDPVLSLPRTSFDHIEDVLNTVKPQRSASISTMEQHVVRFYYGTEASSNDFPTKERRIFPQHEYDPHCEPIDPSWQSTSFPTCNNVHEDSITEALVDETQNLLSSKGFWRHAWKKLDITSQVKIQNFPMTVWKTMKFQHDFEEAYFEYNRVDAIAMERLTSSRNIIDIYAFCGTSLVTEYAGKDLTALIRQLTSTERLKMAIQVAEGLADVHSITPDRPSLVHNDINLANLVLTEDNRAVLNDFNIAVLLMKHNETNCTCPFVSRFPNPQWRSPEEQVASEDEALLNPPRVTEKVDIYALGNVFYRLAVNSSPWKQPNKQKLSLDQKEVIARLKRINGVLPPIPRCIEDYPDPAVQVLLEAMRQAYRYKPEERPSAQAIVTFLSTSLDEISRMNHTELPPLWDGTGKVPQDCWFAE